MLQFTPENIQVLGHDEVFVFGSNLQGNHAGGAARVAREKFGARMGQGVGFQGQSYAIPTMQGSVDSIKPYVDDFLHFAHDHYNLTFYVTRIGCGNASFRDEDIAPLFAEAVLRKNIVLPESFLKVILDNAKKLSDTILTPWPNQHYSLFDMLLDETLALASLPEKWTYDSLGKRLEREASKALRSLAIDWFGDEAKGFCFIEDHVAGIIGGSAWNEAMTIMEEEFQVNAYPIVERPWCRYYIAQSLRVARAMFEMLTPEQINENKGPQFNGIFGYYFFSILTGRHSCGDFSYLFKGLDSAIVILKRIIKERWAEMDISSDGFDRQRLISVFANPENWMQFEDIRKDASAVLENIVARHQSRRSHYKQILVPTDVFFIPTLSYNAPVFSLSKGRLHFPSFYLKKAFIDSHRVKANGKE